MASQLVPGVPGMPKAASSAASLLSADAPQIIEHVAKSLTFNPADVKWVPASPRIAVMGGSAKGTGIIAVYELSPGDTKLLRTIEKPQSIRCGTFGASFLEDRHLATGDYKGCLAILDLEAPDVAVWRAGSAHASMINCIDGCGGLNIGGGAPELVTGGHDGAVRVWDPRVPDPVVALEAAAGETARDCWTVAFGNSYNDTERCIVAGYDNGDVKLFDLRTQTMRWEANVGNGVVGAEFDRKDIEMNKLVVTTLESRFHLFDMRTQHPTEGFASLSEKAHKSTVWSARHLPQNRDVFATTGGNGGINLYKYVYPDRRSIRDPEGKAKGVVGSLELLNSRVVSTQPVMSWDWSPDKEGLAAAITLDQHLRVFLVTRLNKL